MGKNIKSGAGFTVIELIVTIAIIAVLAVIVVTNVSSYINKSKNAAIKANLGNELAEATKYFDDAALGNGTYNGWCISYSATKFTNAATAAGATDLSCQCDRVPMPSQCVTGINTKWCTSVTLVGGGTYCVDSSGAKKTGSTCLLGICS